MYLANPYGPGYTPNIEAASPKALSRGRSGSWGSRSGTNRNCRRGMPGPVLQGTSTRSPGNRGQRRKRGHDAPAVRRLVRTLQQARGSARSGPGGRRVRPQPNRDSRFEIPNSRIISNEGRESEIWNVEFVDLESRTPQMRDRRRDSPAEDSKRTSPQENRDFPDSEAVFTGEDLSRTFARKIVRPEVKVRGIPWLARDIVVRQSPSCSWPFS